jgi:hypothetical protein
MTRVPQELIDAFRPQYRKAGRSERSKILDVFVQTAGCHRKYAIAVLCGRQRQDKGPAKRPRQHVYGEEEVQALLVLSDLFDGICSKRLRAALDVELERLYFSGSLNVSPSCYEKLTRISPATIDRLLKGRRAHLVKSRGHTKPGTLLKHQIPIRTWAEWTEDRPGFCEMDLVDHSGGRVIRGTDHAWTLCFTDVFTGWTECVAVRNKAQVHVFEAIQHARSRLPFPLLGVDSDNGSEFINDQMVRYCRAEQITFTRGRVGNKNDSAYAEQKNWSVVRRIAGYLRYDTPQQLGLLNRIYRCVHYHGNFFLPVMKLASKTRVGSHVTRTYGEPQTPFARVVASPDVADEFKDQLVETYQLLDLVDLRQQIDSLLDALLSTAPAF